MVDSDIGSGLTITGTQQVNGNQNVAGIITVQSSSALTPTTGQSVALIDAGTSSETDLDGPLLQIYNPGSDQPLPTIGSWASGSGAPYYVFASTGGLWSFVKAANLTNAQILQGGPGYLILNGDAGSPPNLMVDSGKNFEGVAFGGYGLAIQTISGGSRIGQIVTYNGVNTAGLGVPAIYGAISQVNVTSTANASLLSYTPPAQAGTYRVLLAVTVSSATSGVVSLTLTWKNAYSVSESAIAILLFQNQVATPATSFTTSAAGYYAGDQVIDIDNSQTPIVLGWVGGGTITAKVSATIEQMAHP
jgi:hypothetical protein